MNAKGLLQAAKAKIATPETWTQRDYARDKNDDGVWAKSPKACKFCAIGAVNATATDVTMVVARQAKSLLAKAARDLYHQGVVFVNDGGTHADVMAVYDRAIERAPS